MSDFRIFGDGGLGLGGVDNEFHIHWPLGALAVTELAFGVSFSSSSVPTRNKERRRGVGGWGGQEYENCSGAQWGDRIPPSNIEVSVSQHSQPSTINSKHNLRKKKSFTKVKITYLNNEQQHLFKYLKLFFLNSKKQKKQNKKKKKNSWGWIATRPIKESLLVCKKTLVCWWVDLSCLPSHVSRQMSATLQ